MVQTSTGILTGLLMLLSLGCESGMSAQDRASLSEAAQLVERGQVVPAVSRLDRIIQQQGQSPEAAEAYYLRGLCRSRMNQLQPAAMDFLAAVEHGQRKDLIAKARASLAMIHYGWGNWERAADLYDQSVDELEDRPPTELILYYAGMAMQRAGRWPASRLHLARLLTVPALRERPIAREAYLKYTWPYDYFSIQLGSFSDATRAGAAARGFRERGLSAWEELRQGTNPPRWVVLTGRYPTYAEAVAALAHMRKYQADAHIVP